MTDGTYQGEFLILKFDKSAPWPRIAQSCVSLLGDKIYKGTGNLNKKHLFQLQGKVIVLFMDGAEESGQTAHAAGTRLKVYIPNIVMIDFASDRKCQKIYDLNTVASTEITNAFQALDQEIQRNQQVLQGMNARGGRVRRTK